MRAVVEVWPPALTVVNFWVAAAAAARAAIPVMFEVVVTAVVVVAAELATDKGVRRICVVWPPGQMTFIWL